MFADDIRRALQGTPRERLAELSAAVWKGFASGALSEEDAQALAEAVEARKAIPAAPKYPRRVGSRPRSPESMERRRRWTSSGWLPPTLAARFTMGEAAAMAVIMREIATTGRCGLPMGAIAGRAGVCATTVRNAVREARNLGLVAVEVRRVSYSRNLPNLITIASRELTLWVRTRARVDREGGGCKSVVTTTNHLSPSAGHFHQVASLRGSREGWRPHGLGAARAAEREFRVRK